MPNSSTNNKVSLTCSFCGGSFRKLLRNYKWRIKKGQKEFFCSRSCVSRGVPRKPRVKPSKKLEKLKSTLGKTGLQKIVYGSTSLTDALIGVGWGKSGSAYSLLRKAIEDLGVDASNLKNSVGGYTGKGKPSKPFHLLKGDPSRKKRLLKERGRTCQVCRHSYWMGKEVPIELDHIDGDSENNDKSNLRLICPNCHAQTDTYKAKNRGNASKERRRKYKKYPIQNYR